MNYNVITYCFYFAITFYILLYVGSTLYRSGCPFLLDIFLGNATIADAVNKILLLGYYIVNLGYIIIVLRIWDNVGSLLEMINILAYKIGLICMTLGTMHLLNIIILFTIGKIVKKRHSINSININQ